MGKRSGLTEAETEAVKVILAARTREQIAEAKHVRAEFLKLHPGNLAIASAGSQLSMMEGALDAIEKERDTLGEPEVHL